MKKMNTTGKYTDKDWTKLASVLSDEKIEDKGLLGRFMADDRYNTINKWKETGKMNTDKEINVDKAWNKLYDRLNENGLVNNPEPLRISFIRNPWFRIAAAVLLLLSLGTATLLISDNGLLSNKIVVTTTGNQKNLEVTLPDGSNIFLNRNTRLTYRENFGRHGRNVTLTGEAFFEIAPDPAKPFMVDAGKARVKVTGTSFNVITNNPDYAVEVYVRTGKVELSDNTGNKSIELDPGYIGTINTVKTGKSMNSNPNYLSWNTGLLVYDGQTLDVVFRDLKRVYNMEIIADNPEILNKTWTSPIDNQPQETIIRLICASFNLNFSKVENVYHLSTLR
jgi:ferric-dicitrate binding protein FerR (iron transport regulator)